MRKLLVTSGPAAGHEVEIERELVIGRDDADLVIADGEMSRRHAVVRPIEQGVEIEDLGSLNGTFVDGQRISAPARIVIRGAVKMGTSEFRIDVDLPQVTQAAPALQPDVTLARAAPPLAATVAREAPVPSQATPGAPAWTPPEAPAGTPPATPAPASGLGEQSRVESPNLPIPVSIAIFVAATVAVVVLLVLTLVLD